MEVLTTIISLHADFTPPLCCSAGASKLSSYHLDGNMLLFSQSYQGKTLLGIPACSAGRSCFHLLEYSRSDGQIATCQWSVPQLHSYIIAHLEALAQSIHNCVMLQEYLFLDATFLGRGCRSSITLKHIFADQRKLYLKHRHLTCWLFFLSLGQCRSNMLALNWN